MATVSSAARRLPADDGCPKSKSALTVHDLSIDVVSARGSVNVVRRVSFELDRGRTLGIVGESGCGKTLTSLAIMNLLPTAARISGGAVFLDDEDLTAMSPRELERVKGSRIGMVFQDPMRSLNPSFTVGEQVAEVVRKHLRLSRHDAWTRAVDMLAKVQIGNPSQRAHEYPSAFSGGMAQRVMIAMALAADPDILVADEPTTALDVTVQADVLMLLQELQAERQLGILLVTHDLGVVAEMCDEVAVMYAGEIVETGDVAATFMEPAHPYTTALLGAIPDSRRGVQRFDAIPGRVPLPYEWPEGCRFHPRCPSFVAGRCDAIEPVPVLVRPGHMARCLRADELSGKGL